MKRTLQVAALVAALAPGMALATVGYFQHGYGIRAKGMGGVGIALPQDALAAATNPAGMAWIGNRLDVGLERLSLDRGAELTGKVSANGTNHGGTFDGNGTGAYNMPEFGYNRMLTPRVALGIAIFGSAMSAEYASDPLSPLTGSPLTRPARVTGIELQQLFAAPTVAWKHGAHAFGASLVLAYQRFQAQGLVRFDNQFMSSNPENVTDRGEEDSTGAGVRVGWVGEVAPGVTVGATYQTRIRMSPFTSYSGLLAEQGQLDVPANYGVGMALKATPRLTLAADVQRIEYAKVAALGNPIDCVFVGDNSEAPGECVFGDSDGPGFGWRNTTAIKLGVAYELDSRFTLRAGFVSARQPIPASQTMLNVYLPAVAENHLTLGATWRFSPSMELSVAYLHAFENKVSGSGSIDRAFQGGEANLRMSQDALGLGFGWRY